jgi:hypothetical protein
MNANTPELPSTRITYGVHCLHIRHKGMFLSLDPDVDPDVNNELFDSGCYWCAVTQTSFGPDGHPCRADICQGERSCCAH